MTDYRPSKIMRILAASTAALAFGSAVAQTAVMHPLINVNSNAMAYRSYISTKIYQDSGKNPDAQGATSGFILDFEQVLRTPRAQAAYSTSARPDPNSPNPNLRAIGSNVFRVHAAVSPAALDAEGISKPKDSVAAYVCAHQWNEQAKAQNLVGTYQITYSGEVKPDAWDGPREAAKSICNAYITARLGTYNQRLAQMQQPTTTAAAEPQNLDALLASLASNGAIAKQAAPRAP